MRKLARVFLALLLLSAPAGAADPQKTDGEIRRKAKDLDRLQSELNRLRREREKVKEEADQLSDRIKQTEKKARTVEESLAQTRERTSVVTQDLARTKISQDQILAGIEDTQGLLRQSVRVYAMASALRGSEDALPAYARQVIAAKASALRGMHERRQQVSGHLATLVETQAKLNSELRQKEQSLTGLRTGAKDQSRQLEKKMTRQQSLEGEMKDLEKNAKELASLIDRLRTRAREEKESERAARVERQRSGHSPIAAHSLPWPIIGKVVTRFGRQTDPTLGSSFISNGIVIRQTLGGPVRTVADGQVLFAGEFMNYGFMIVVEHPGDWYSVYGRLGRWSVEKGQALKVGDEIGWPGAVSGGSKEAYFELRFYGKPTDPVRWLEN